MLGRLHRPRRRRHRAARHTGPRPPARRLRRLPVPGLPACPRRPAGWIGVIDTTLAGRGTGGTVRLRPLTDADDHPRVRHARRLRTGIRVFGDDRGLVTLATGLAGRTELSIELRRPEDGGRGHGRSLLTDALTLVPEDDPVFAAVSPGNARSLRAFLATGFTPIGAEALIRPDGARA